MSFYFYRFINWILNKSITRQWVWRRPYSIICKYNLNQIRILNNLQFDLIMDSMDNFPLSIWIEKDVCLFFMFQISISHIWFDLSNRILLDVWIIIWIMLKKWLSVTVASLRECYNMFNRHANVQHIDLNFLKVPLFGRGGISEDLKSTLITVRYSTSHFSHLPCPSLNLVSRSFEWLY